MMGQRQEALAALFYEFSLEDRKRPLRADIKGVSCG